jgi:O-methyltransferase
MRTLAKRIAAAVPVNLYQRLLAYSVIRHEFPATQSAVAFPSRERLWDDALARAGGSVPITFVEFGVRAGYSIKYFANANRHPQSRFIGLDSFEGLPEDWDLIPKGTFDVRGAPPAVDDSRIAFIKGWFQNTAHLLLRRIDPATCCELLVHYDADLYSSTLYALAQIDTLKKDYLAIFDEFVGHEARALYNYAQSFNAQITILAKTILWSQPRVVLCKIAPNKEGSALAAG